MENKVRVIFRTDKHTGEVIAWFPELAGTKYYLHDCQTYQHMGQHGSGTFNYYYETTRPSKSEEIKPLLDELTSIGYNVAISKRMTHADFIKRRSQARGE